jgi:hypothetical protein
MNNGEAVELMVEAGKYTYRQVGGRQEVFRYGETWRDVTGDKFIGAMADEILHLRAAVVSVFDHDYPPYFRQGYPVHELEDLTTAEQCNGMVAEIESLRTYNLVLNRRPAIPGKFEMGDTVRKIKGSQWSGKIVGTYSTEFTPEGYVVESSTARGAVHTFPADELEHCPAR